jgi:hypothetical protein
MPGRKVTENSERRETTSTAQLGRVTEIFSSSGSLPLHEVKEKGQQNNVMKIKLRSTSTQLPLSLAKRHVASSLEGSSTKRGVKRF